MPIDPEVAQQFEELREDLRRLDELRARLARTSPPVGSIILLAATQAPNGYLPCDGREVSRTEQAELFLVIGTTWGAGDGVTTFNLPDLGGVFPRIHDGGSGRDPGRVMGMIQTDATRMPRNPFFIAEAGKHTHGLSNAENHSHSLSNNGMHSHRMEIAGDHSHMPFRDNGREGQDGLQNCALKAVANHLSGPHPVRTSVDGAHVHTIQNGGNHTHVVSPGGAHSHIVEAVSDHTHAIIGGDTETRPLNHVLAAFIRI